MCIVTVEIHLLRIDGWDIHHSRDSIEATWLENVLCFKPFTSWSMGKWTKKPAKACSRRRLQAIHQRNGFPWHKTNIGSWSNGIQPMVFANDLQLGRSEILRLIAIHKKYCKLLQLNYYHLHLLLCLTERYLCNYTSYTTSSSKGDYEVLTSLWKRWDDRNGITHQWNSCWRGRWGLPKHEGHWDRDVHRIMYNSVSNGI